MFKEKIRKILNNEFFEKSIMALILLNLLVFILDTMQSFHSHFEECIALFETFSIVIFTMEYFLRIISIQKLTDVFKPMMLIDFAAIAPFYLSFLSVNTIFLRIFRLSRILRILKIGRYSNALDNIINAFKEKKEELVITFSIFFIGVLISSILLYFAENQAQPEIFSSIPKTFYFSLITFTTVGYGDVTTITTLGKIVSCISAIFGVGLHGLFIGIIGTAFMRAFHK